MPIIDGNPVNGQYTNSKLVSKLAENQDLLGSYNLNNLSSAPITDIQQKINDILADVSANQSSIVVLTDSTQENATAINAIEQEIALGAKKVKSYETDIAYVNENGAPTGGEFYYNSTLGSIRFFDAVTVAWKNLGGNTVGVQESLGIGDGIADTFGIASTPITDESIVIFLNGVAQDKATYTIDLPNIIFNVAPAPGREVYAFYLTEGVPSAPIVSSGTQVLQYRTISAGEITSGSLILPSIPANPLGVMVDYVEAGSPLVYTESFVVSGDELSWSGRLIDGFISQGERLRIMYFV